LANAFEEGENLIQKLLQVEAEVESYADRSRTISAETAPVGRELYCSYWQVAASLTGESKLKLNQVNPRLCDRLVVTNQEMPLTDKDLSLKFASLAKELEFINAVKSLKRVNPYLRVYLDPFIVYSSKLVNQIKDKKVSVQKKVKQWVTFVARLRVVDGLVIRTTYDVNVDPVFTEQFFMKLSEFAHYANLHLFGFIFPFDDSIRVAFPYFDRIIIGDHSKDAIKDNKLRHQMATFRRQDDTGFEALLNKDFEWDYYISLGANPEKFIAAFYIGAYQFELAHPRLTAIGVERKPQEEEKALPITEVCNNYEKSSWNFKFDPEHKVPFAFNSTHWHAYDNRESYMYKLELVKAKNMRGVYVDSLDFDDFRGMSCQNGRYPITNLIKKNL